jgi:hypothetical protein
LDLQNDDGSGWSDTGHSWRPSPTPALADIPPYAKRIGRSSAIADVGTSREKRLFRRKADNNV